MKEIYNKIIEIFNKRFIDSLIMIIICGISSIILMILGLIFGIIKIC